MSEVKSFTGFIAIDGSTHSSKSAAIAHTREVKVKAALAEKFAHFDVVTDADEVGTPLDEFIFAHREMIVAALNQEVRLRAPRTTKPKAPKTAQTPEPTAAA